MENHTTIVKHKRPLWRSKNPVKMRESIWSVPSYVEDPLECMEEGRPQQLLFQAFSRIPGDTWEEKLSHCSSCQCCARHQTFRPSRLVHWTDADAKRDLKITYRSMPSCPCNCRHMARFICRQVEPTVQPRAAPILEDEM